MKLVVQTTRLVVILLGAASFAAAQTATGQITGTVKDSTGAVVAGANITVSSQLTGSSRKTTTNEAGAFSVPLLPVSTYSITAERPGFKAAKRSDLKLNVDQVVRVDLDLEVGTVSETVEVKDTSIAIDSESAAIGQVVSTRQVTELPLNGRNFLSLLFIGAGAVETSGEQGGMRQGVGNAISINGSRPTSNNYLLDGMSNTDTALNTPAVVLSVDAIQEFKEQTTTYSAEYGFSANQINIISKGGTNDLHGAFFWFGRNNALDARNFFQASIAPLRQNQYGFVLGGPAYLPKIYNGRNKTFWMVNYEASKIRAGVDSFANIPTPEALAGRFSTAIRDPYNGNTPFPGNAVPDSRVARFSQIARAKFYPAPNINLAQGNYRVTRSLPLDTNQQTVRADQMLGKYGTFFGRFTRSNFTNTAIGNIIPLGDVYFNQKNTNWQVSHSVTLGPRVVNQFRFGRMEATANQFGVPAPQADVDALKLTGVFTGLNDQQRMYPSVAFSAGGLAGSGGAVNAFQASNQPMYDMGNSTTIIHGNHTIGFGINYRRFKLQRDLANNFLGNFTYSGDFTGNPVADMLLGVYSSASAFQPAGFSVGGSVGNPREFNFQYIAPYVQDDWKVTQHLTLNIGMRYDFRAMPYETNDRMGWLDPENKRGGLLVADKTLQEKGIIVAGGFYRLAGRRNPQDASRRVLAPRLGFAFRPFGGDKTVIRGGYGVFFDSAENREIDGSADIYPYVSRGNYQQTPTQTTPIKTTNDLFPSFASLGPVTPAANSFLAVSMSRYPRNPYVQQWSLSIQRALTNTVTLEANYIGNKGTHLLMRRQINQSLAYDPARPLSVNDRHPYPDFGIYIDSDWSGNSSYNSGNLRLEKRTSSMVITAVYTWAKSLDNKSAAAGIGNSFAGWQGFLYNHNARLDRGRSDFNVDHRFVSSFVYSIPVGRGAKYMASIPKAVDMVIGGWQVNGIVTFQKGFPYDIFSPDDGGLNDSFGSGRADTVSGVSRNGPKTINQWFNTAAFSKTKPGKFGTSGRGILNAPGINNWDTGLFKNFRFTERVTLQFRLESFNAFNHTQFSVPSRDLSSPTYGAITSTRAARVNQLGLKLLF